jgi:maltokinase
MSFEDALATWLQEQRWFAGKGRTLRDLAVVADTEVAAGDPALRHLIVVVSHGATADHYQILVGLRSQLPGWLEHARIGMTEDGRHAYDALHDPALTRHLLRAIAGGETIDSLRFERMPAAEIETDLDSIVLTGEQSNTSLVYGETSILKVFRRVAPGPNPDLEVTSALAQLGSSHIAEPFGWIETRMDGVPTTLAILSRYLRTATDGWTMAATSVRDLYASDGTSAADAGGDFSGEAYRLGAATAEVHRDLAEAFGTDELSPDALHEMAEQMYRRLDLATAAVPELARFADMIGAAYSSLAKIDEPMPAQRVHGDYHLGQVMRTETGWVVLDFEGEPASPLAQRRARSSPLRDVAGMLRSFDYAARHQLLTHPDAERLRVVARDWIRCNADAFCAGYAEAGGLDPRANEVLLRALELDKAVYEVMYEARHRPSWLPIPLESLADFSD